MRCARDPGILPHDPANAGPCGIVSGFAPAPAFAKSVTRSGRGRIFPLFSRVVRAGPFTDVGVEMPGSVLFGPIFSGPDDRADLADFLQHRKMKYFYRKMKYFLAHAFVLRNRWRSPNATEVQTEVGHSGGSGSVKQFSMFPLCSESALCYAKSETVRRAVGAEIRDRMDGRDLESGDRMHEGRPRVRQLLCRAVRGTLARRSRSSVRAGLRPEALAAGAAQIANGYGSGATRSATAPATFSSAPVTACKSSKEISASFSRRTNRASSMSMTARDV